MLRCPYHNKSSYNVVIIEDAIELLVRPHHGQIELGQWHQLSRCRFHRTTSEAAHDYKLP